MPHTGKHYQSSTESSTASDIFEEKNKENMSQEKLEPAIPNQLAEVIMKYWTEESKSSVAVNKILEMLTF